MAENVLPRCPGAPVDFLPVAEREGDRVRPCRGYLDESKSRVWDAQPGDEAHDGAPPAAQRRGSG